MIGFPALAYVLAWAAVRMPSALRGIGRRNDYSYGVYIYGFIGQQVFASLGWSRWGYLPYIAMSLAAAFAAALLSWHLVERRALAWKDWAPRRRKPAPLTPPATVRLPVQAYEPAMLRRPEEDATPVAGRTG